MVVLTGATSIIGRLLAIQLAKKGAKLACWDDDGEALEKLKTELKNLKDVKDVFKVCVRGWRL